MKPLYAMLLCFSVAHADDWTTQDTIRQVALQTVIAADWMQTRQIAKHPDSWYETNAMLGDHPSVAQVNQYFIASSLVAYGIARALPGKWRAPYQYIYIGYEGNFVANNLRLGIRVKF